MQLWHPDGEASRCTVINMREKLIRGSRPGRRRGNGQMSGSLAKSQDRIRSMVLQGVWNHLGRGDWGVHPEVPSLSHPTWLQELSIGLVISRVISGKSRDVGYFQWNWVHIAYSLSFSFFLWFFSSQVLRNQGGPFWRSGCSQILLPALWMLGWGGNQIHLGVNGTLGRTIEEERKWEN